MLVVGSLRLPHGAALSYPVQSVAGPSRAQRKARKPDPSSRLNSPPTMPSLP